MTCPECTKEMGHFLRSACTPMGGLSELIRKKCNQLYTAQTDEERAKLVNMISTVVDMLTGSVYNMEQIIFEIEQKGLDGFLEHRKIMHKAERAR